MELKQFEVSFGNLNIKIPYYEIGEEGAGPDLFISAGMHGDEVNGVYMVKNIVEWMHSEQIEGQLKGRLFIFPVLNPTAFEQNSRVTPEDGKDLNRQFGELNPTSISEQIASELVENFFKKCEMGIDFHDAGDGAVFIPHARIHYNDEDDCVSCTREMARIFGTEYILERNGHKKMMAVYLNNERDTPVITVEVGGAGHIHPDLLEIGMKGVKNVLKGYQMIPGELELPEKQYAIYKRNGVRTVNAGLIQFSIRLGDKVKSGDKLGEIYIPSTQQSEEIRAPISGVIFSLWPHNQVAADRTIFSIVDTEANVQDENTMSTEKPEDGIIVMKNYQSKDILL